VLEGLQLLHGDPEVAAMPGGADGGRRSSRSCGRNDHGQSSQMCTLRFAGDADESIFWLI